MQDELLPLVAERLACNVAMLIYGMTNVLMESRHAACKLNSNTCNELGGITCVSATSNEEKAGPEPLCLEVSAGDSPCNGRLSRAS
jgi:hypothetical protein